MSVRPRDERVSLRREVLDGLVGSLLVLLIVGLDVEDDEQMVSRAGIPLGDDLGSALVRSVVRSWFVLILTQNEREI